MLEHPDGRVWCIEVKATSTPRAEDLRGLVLAERLDDRFQFGVLLTATPEATPFGPTLVRRYPLARSGPANSSNKRGTSASAASPSGRALAIYPDGPTIATAGTVS